MKCKEVVQIFGSSATYMSSYDANRKARKAYTKGRFEQALAYYAYGYGVGSTDSAKSLLFMLENNKIGEY